MNRYKVVGPRAVLDAEPGQEFDYEFSEVEEADMLAAGRLEIVPCRYQVVGGSEVFETKPGDYFEAALLVGQEAALLAGGHIERAKPAKKSKEKED